MNIKEKCIFCTSEDIECLGVTQIYRKAVTVERTEFQTTTQESTIIFSINEYLCLSCGAVFKTMPKNLLDDYNREKENFVNPL